MNDASYLYIKTIDFKEVKSIGEHLDLSRMSLDAASQTIYSILIINRLRNGKKFYRKLIVINAQTIRANVISKHPSIQNDVFLGSRFCKPTKNKYLIRINREAIRESGFDSSDLIENVYFSPNVLFDRIPFYSSFRLSFNVRTPKCINALVILYRNAAP